MRNIFGDQGNKERNFWEQGNSVKVNFGEHLNLFLKNKGKTVNVHREQGNMHPPLEGPLSSLLLQCARIALYIKVWSLSSSITLYILSSVGFLYKREHY